MQKLPSLDHRIVHLEGRLKKFAHRLSQKWPHFEVEDLVQEALARMLTYDLADKDDGWLWAYGSTTLKRLWLTKKRAVKGHEFLNRIKDREYEDIVEIEWGLPKCWVSPEQIDRIFFLELFEKVTGLPDVFQETLRGICLDEPIPEIARLIGTTEGGAKKIINELRQFLRESGFNEFNNKPTSPRGIERIGRKWRARYRKDKKLFELGSFDRLADAISARKEFEESL